MERQVEGLLNGRKPDPEYLFGAKSAKLANALAARIDVGVGRSLCAHAMCSSSASGNLAVVKMLAARPMSTFNQAYNFGEPLRRACRAFVRADNQAHRAACFECAIIIASAGGDPDQPDKYRKSGISASEFLRTCGDDQAVNLAEKLDEIKRKLKAPIKEEKISSTKVKAETQNIENGNANEKKGKTRKIEELKEEPNVANKKIQKRKSMNT